MKQGQVSQSFATRTCWSYKTPTCNSTRGDFSHRHHQMVNNKFRLTTLISAKDGELYPVSKNKSGNWLWLDCELLVAKFKLKLQKVRKTSKPFRYDLNQISHDFAVEMINGFKGLDLIGRLHEELWVEVWNIVEKVVNKTIHKKKKGKMIGKAL